MSSSFNVSVRWSIFSILSPLVFLLLLLPIWIGLLVNFNINPLYLKNNRASTIITTSYHHLLIISPAFHDASTLQCSIDITTDGIPCLRTKPAVKHMPKVIPISVALKDKLISRFETWTWTTVRVCQILLLIILVAFAFKDSDFTFMFDCHTNKYRCKFTTMLFSLQYPNQGLLLQYPMLETHGSL